MHYFEMKKNQKISRQAPPQLEGDTPSSIPSVGASILAHLALDPHDRTLTLKKVTK